MTEAEYKDEFKTLVGTFDWASRKIGEWHKYANGETTIRPTTELRYLFRPGSILVKDTLKLVSYLAKAGVAKNEAKKRLTAIVGLIRPIVTALDGFITVPTVRITADVDDVRRLFSLIHERLKDGMTDGTGGVDLTVPEYTGDNKAHKKAMKDLMHRLSQVMIGDKKLPAVRKFTQVRNYIISCTREDRYYTQCKAIQDAIKVYEWKPSSLVTYCKQGSVEVKKTNDKRQAKINKRKRLVDKSLDGAWHDGVP